MQTEWPDRADDTADDTADGPGPTAWSSVSDGSAPGVAADPDGPTPGDGGPATEEEREHHRTAVDAVDRLLDEVERALARLDDGTYGRCEACGEPIADDRLSDHPIVRTCGRCDEVGGGADAAEATGPLTP